MAKNQTGIAITIKAFLPIGKTVPEQLAALTMVQTAHETGDYAEVLKAAKVDEVKSEQKTRRVEEEVKPEPEPEADPDFDDLDETISDVWIGDDADDGIDNEFGDDDIIPSQAAE